MHVKVIFTAEVSPDFVSSQIMKKYNKPYSHVAILYDDQFIFHATGKGVHVQSYESYIAEGHTVPLSFNVELKVSRDFFMGYVSGSEGKEYSQSQIAGIASGKTVHNGNEKMICSELVGKVLSEMAGVHIPGDQDAWSPSDIEHALIKHLA